MNIIRNQTQVDAGGTAELIPVDEYLKVSDLYGYQVVLTNPYFKNYYTLTLKPQANMKVTEEVRSDLECASFRNDYQKCSDSCIAGCYN